MYLLHWCIYEHNIYNTSTNIHLLFTWMFLQSVTMWAASVAHGAGSTSRHSMVMCTSFLACVNTTWSPTAMTPSQSSLCTWRGMKTMETRQSVMWWSPSPILHFTSARMWSLWTTCRKLKKKSNSARIMMTMIIFYLRYIKPIHTHIPNDMN